MADGKPPPMSGTDLQGHRLGPYQVCDEIGRGGMARVFRARDKDLDRDVALKVLPKKLAGTKEMVERFRIEAKALGRQKHPNIVTTFTASVDDDPEYAYIAMPLFSGGSLADRMQGDPKDVPRDPAECIEVVRQIARGLDAAHAKNIVHRDLKPGNVLIDDDGTLCISDFGLARVLDSDSEGITGPMEVMGTPWYMSPEQCQGAKVGPPSDLYSLGVIAYELLCGRPPFLGSVADILRAHVALDPPPVGSFRPDLPGSLDLFFGKALAKDPSARFETAGQLAESLETYFTVTTGIPDPPPVPPPPPPAPDGAGAPWLARLAVAGFLVACAVGASALTWFSQGPQDPADSVVEEEEGLLEDPLVGRWEVEMRGEQGGYEGVLWVRAPVDAGPHTGVMDLTFVGTEATPASESVRQDVEIYVDGRSVDLVGVASTRDDWEADTFELTWEGAGLRGVTRDTRGRSGEVFLTRPGGPSPP